MSAKRWRFLCGCLCLWGLFGTISETYSQTQLQATPKNNSEKDTTAFRTLYFLSNNIPYERETFIPVNHEGTYLHLGKDFFPFGSCFGQTLSSQGSAYRSWDIDNSRLLVRNFIPDVHGNSFYTVENVRRYQVNHPYTYLSYLGGTQSTNGIRAIHSQNISKGWNAALDIKAFLTDGQFHRSEMRSQSFNVTTNYISDKGRYRITGGYIRNSAKNMENGGLLFDTVFTEGTISNTNAMPVRLSEASNAWQNNELFYAQSFNLNPYDTTKQKGTVFSCGILSHKASFRHHKKIFTDNLGTDSLYSQTFLSATITNDSLAYRSLSNTLQWSNDSYDDKFYSNPLTFSAGLTHSLYEFYDISKEYNGQRWQPFSKIKWNSGYFSLMVQCEYVFSRQEDRGEQYLTSILEIPTLWFLKNIRLSAERRKEAPLFFLQHIHGNHFQWDNNFQHSDTWGVHLSLSPLQGITLGGNFYRKEHHVYLSETLHPTAATKPGQLLSAYLQHRLLLGIFRFEGCVLLQNSNNNEVFRLPTFAFNEILAIHFGIFKKKLTGSIGLDVSYHTKYFADGYDPTLGAFYHQDSVEIGNYVYADVFVEAKVESVRFFFKVGHPYAGLLGGNSFNTPHYPHENFSLRWGASWEFGN